MGDDNKDKYNREDNEGRQGILRRMRTRVNERSHNNQKKKTFKLSGARSTQKLVEIRTFLQD